MARDRLPAPDAAGGTSVAAPARGPDPAGPLSGWFATHVPGSLLPLRIEELSGGRSNLTLVVTDAAGTRHVLRMPPPGPVLATAHDVLREARILRAIGPTAVPVPRVVAVCEDPSVAGAPFVVSRFAEGRVLRDAASACEAPAACRAASGHQLVGALARLHSLRPDDVGLGDLVRGGDYVDRQLRRWSRQVEDGGGEYRTMLLDLAGRVGRAVPAQERVALVHGDPKLDNCILDDGGGLRAIVDWELAAVGDPVADLALLLAYWGEPGDAEVALQDPPSGVPGFATRAELVATYREVAGWEPRGVEAYLAFCYWKLACIVAGVVQREAIAAARTTATPGPDLVPFRAQVERLARLTEAALADGR
ncbi:phosphotransferase family protein [Pseudonocardia aurantiaca]|uniref:Phosphotransferase family protein n=1 Tax=Pseudonocardia aurantiaca TaxID=75290 RepID=A0ABW4FQ48_9PSEU